MDPRTPLNSWVHDTLQRQTRNVFRNSDRFTATFDKLEILLALGSESVPSGREHPTLLGCFFWRGATRDRFLTDIRESLNALGERSPYVNSGMCGDNPKDCRERIERLEEMIAQVGWDRFFNFERTKQDQRA